jgi:hypothetical protein
VGCAAPMRLQQTAFGPVDSPGHFFHQIATWRLRTITLGQQEFQPGRIPFLLWSGGLKTAHTGGGAGGLNQQPQPGRLTCDLIMMVRNHVSQRWRKIPSRSKVPSDLAVIGVA